MTENEKNKQECDCAEDGIKSNEPANKQKVNVDKKSKDSGSEKADKPVRKHSNQSGALAGPNTQPNENYKRFGDEEYQSNSST